MEELFCAKQKGERVQYNENGERILTLRHAILVGIWSELIINPTACADKILVHSIAKERWGCLTNL